MEIGSSFAILIRRTLRPKGKEEFVASLPSGACILDVGCGNNSPFITKAQRPDLYYVGLDIGDYRQSAPPQQVANEYIVCSPADFADTIATLGQRFDALVSNHNIEHCDDPGAVLKAMCACLKPNGVMYIAWPAEHTVNLPSRTGTLNFYDDPTHKHPLPYEFVASACERNGCEPLYTSKAYRPLLSVLIGALFEPISAAAKRTMPLRSTWALYGFESILWARKKV